MHRCRYAHSVHWSSNICWASEIHMVVKSEHHRHTPFLSHLHFQLFTGHPHSDFFLYIKNNFGKVELIISTLKSAFFLASLHMLMALSLLQLLRPQAPNVNSFFSFASYNGSVNFTFQIPCHFLFSILSLPYFITVPQYLSPGIVQSLLSDFTCIFFLSLKWINC